MHTIEEFTCIPHRTTLHNSTTIARSKHTNYRTPFTRIEPHNIFKRCSSFSMSRTRFRQLSLLSCVKFCFDVICCSLSVCFLSVVVVAIVFYSFSLSLFPHIILVFAIVQIKSGRSLFVHLLFWCTLVYDFFVRFFFVLFSVFVWFVWISFDLCSLHCLRSAWMSLASAAFRSHALRAAAECRENPEENARFLRINVRFGVK